jgi:hypothetical protein
MRLPHHIGRVALLVALAFGLHALSGNPFSHRNLTHNPHTNGQHLPSHRTSRLSSRGRRSQSADSSDVVATEEAHAHPAAVAPHALNLAGADHSAQAQVILAALNHPSDITEPLASVSVVALGSAPRAPGSPRGPPLS